MSVSCRHTTPSVAHLVSDDLALGVVLKVAVALEAALDNLAELRSKRVVVEEVVHAEAGARRLRRVRRANAFLRRANAGRDEAQGMTSSSFSCAVALPRPAELDLLEPVDDLVEVENKVCTVGDEESAGAVETCPEINNRG